ncbi:cupin domain-containing protein [Paracoccus sp. Z330]|uniref:Cupin domain-containing protein n=1 Tax=Paracoccus onchidii TaxID=3017813 RepID=A0ABT4ZD61_9RHOB|nr:cupin domain-containing protein [Paracoccus onchidii]MDB6177299.1 cupin domain-containing protein [Paracoccus onchidii]
MTKVLKMTPTGAGDITLEPCSVVPPEAVIDGKPQEMGAVISESKDGSFVVGIWESTPYAEVFDAYPGDEFCQVLSGKVTLTDEHGHEETFAAGDSYFVPKGFRGTFRVVETMRKYYAIHMG